MDAEGGVVVVHELLLRELVASDAGRAVEVDVLTSEGLFRAAAPLVCPPDADLAQCCSQLSAALVDAPFRSSQKADEAIAGAKVPASVSLCASMAVSRAAAAHSGLPLHVHLATRPELRLPAVCFALLAGGRDVEDGAPFLRHMVQGPDPAADPAALRESIRIGCETAAALRRLVQDRHGLLCAGRVCRDGALGVPCMDSRAALEMLAAAAREAGHSGKVRPCIDGDAAALWNAEAERYNLTPHDDITTFVSSDELFALYAELSERYGVSYIRGPCLPGTPAAPGEPLSLRLADFRTVSAAVAAVADAGRTVVLRADGAACDDAFVADLAVGMGVDVLECGAPWRGETTALLNQLLRIAEAEEEAASQAA
eukprot:TRINITY_DN45056_c0_g1_i1.p1 TRINITY_DN45056_c0_g1~~TRINITY_DN45056_c0_g1_i1.p1  ORF type:complete len:370 (+),score=121.15 TRINITY_DN45056_c0_g1_i1:55-1164(+)